MSVDQKDVLIIFSIVMGLLITLRMRWRRQSQVNSDVNERQKVDRNIPAGEYTHMAYDRSSSDDEKPVYFNFNGHMWEAYEALGLSPGCSMELVDKAYQKELQLVDNSSQIFLKMAYDAIKQSQSK